MGGHGLQASTEPPVNHMHHFKTNAEYADKFVNMALLRYTTYSVMKRMNSKQPIRKSYIIQP